MTTNRMGLDQTPSDGEVTVIIDTDHVQCGDAAAMAREILAYRKASKEPVAPFGYVHQCDHFFTNDHGNIYKTPGGNFTRPLYSAPPLQAVKVPNKATWRDAPVNSENVDWAAGWNACRAAMLKNDK